ncbi:MAG: divalent metal cation transporter [Acidobacteriota bacterium]|nr:MAG: divalent metal cation transporter [Acidobacteriota bacterium]
MLSVLLWSAISAAFIGPGTVTTASKAGAQHGMALLWALAFSTAACFVLQEAAARLTVASGMTLGEAIARRSGLRWLPAGVVAAVVIGCAAYQAGNILGVVAGVGLVASVPAATVTLGAGLFVATMLALGSPRAVAHLLGLVVAAMGVAFAACAWTVRPGLDALAAGLVRPSLPAGSSALVLGLIGTTVVPYNLFLGSGLARGRCLSDARFGLAVAIPLGGLISIAILVAGTAVGEPYSFEALARSLERQIGPAGGRLFAFGLGAAGLSSAMTAPLAAALAVGGLVRGRRVYRSVWAGVLGFGLGFGLTGVQPVPVIVLAQALNGLLLPFVALFLMLAVNDRELMGRDHLSGALGNAALGLSVLVSLMLGLRGLAGAFVRVSGAAGVPESWLVGIALVGALVILLPLARIIRRHRS